MTLEGLRLNIRKKLIEKTHKKRKRKLISENFTIISNNCWGGMVYESFGLVKQSPTVGLFFMAEEYLKFLKKFPDILYKDIDFIQPETSKYVEFLKTDSRFGSYPIGRIDDVEICFLHYHSEDEVLSKWKRRCERIDFEHMIVKMNDQNLCTEEHLREFARLNFKNKLIFSAKPYEVSGNVYIKQAKNQEYVMASQEPIIRKKYFDLINYLNQCSG